MTYTVAPVARSFATCVRTSGAVTWKRSSPTMLLAFAPSPASDPRRLSSPKLSFWSSTAIFAFGLLRAIAWP